MKKDISIELEGKTLSWEFGTLAKQSDASVLVRLGDTVVFVTAVWNRAREKKDFLPLLVEYREQAYAAGKIPGGYFKREGRPRDREILYSRAIDRAIRPRFPKGMMDEVEIVTYLLSYDMEHEAHTLGIIGASQALMLSEIPFNGPIAAVRVGRIDGQFVLNPTNSQINESDFDLLLAGSNSQINMIEFTGKEVPEEILVNAIKFALPYIDQICETQLQVASSYGKDKASPTVLELPDEILNRVETEFYKQISDALFIPSKSERQDALRNLQEDIIEKLSEEFPESEVEIKEAIYQIQKKIMRSSILKEGKRIDGRSLEDIRPITIEIGMLPRTHGSALFTRGETQALVVTTLGTEEDAQFLSELDPEERKRFMLHYNFPPFSTGEVGPLRGPSRREVGHGALAEKSIAPLIPSEDEFLYTIRVVSTILESNGSSSMATVCGASLSLMDAGVPIKSSCAGVSIGLVRENDRHVLLTDILGDEDHLGDMDFKVAGTRKGITGIQLDLKIDGLPIDVVEETFERAKKGREHILDIMDAVIPEPRKELSQYAPKVTAIFIPKEKIGAVIGPGGRVIRNILEKTGTRIDIDDTMGKVVITGPSSESIEEARKMVEEIVEDVEVGKVYMGKVVKTTNFGAFVEILPGKEGLVHISELANERIKQVEDVVKVGDKVLVKVIGIDDMGRIRLSRKQALTAGIKKIGKIRR